MISSFAKKFDKEIVANFIPRDEAAAYCKL